MLSLVHVSIVMAIAAGIAVAAHDAVSRSERRGLRLALYLTGVLALGIAVNIALPLAYAAAAYDGACYGFTDGKSACDRLQHLGHSLAMATLLTLPVAFGYVLALLVGAISGIMLRPQPGR